MRRHFQEKKRDPKKLQYTIYPEKIRKCYLQNQRQLYYKFIQGILLTFKNKSLIKYNNTFLVIVLLRNIFHKDYIHTGTKKEERAQLS
jgi:hypothetical protein